MAIKEERSKKVIELSNKNGQEYNEKYIGKKVQVLVEEKQGNIYKGHTANYMYVEIENVKEDIQNKIVEVTIKNEHLGTL